MDDPIEEVKDVKVPDTLPMLPVRDVVVFPYMILPLFVGREASIKAVEHAMAHEKIIFLSAQKDISDENPAPQGIYAIGTYAMVMRMRKLPDGRVKVLIQGLGKGKIQKYTQEDPFYQVKITKLKDTEAFGEEESISVEALVRNVKEQIEKLISMGRVLAPDLLMILDEVLEPGKLADLIASNMGLKVNDAQEVLEIDSVHLRLQKVSTILSRELDVLSLQAKIRSQARDEMTKSQREYFLREQLKAIKSELGDLDSKEDEVEEFRTKIEAAGMPKEVKEEALKQLGRLEKMHPDSSESTVARSYLECVTEVPWAQHSQDNIDIKRAKEILDEDHFGLEKVKERILEFLAVRKLKEHMTGPILCFSGPPGVGKTSLGRSIARAMGRKFVRVSLGGLRDEAEIRGHRRTYVGAMPGKIIQGLKQAQTNNPVFMLDEIDKLGSDFRGDPASALLEVLDPEQNYSFTDHYLNLPYNLSNVLFITTANLVDPVPPALRDRMEVIQLPGYTEDEKVKIAQRFLIPKQLEQNGLKKDQVTLSEDAIKAIIHQYTQEAGLRNLEREFASIFRKVARKWAEDKAAAVSISGKNIPDFLGNPKYLPTEEQQKNEIGVTTGLAWTPYGGEVLYVEATQMKGKNRTLTLTGQLGDVMKESAQAALSYIRSHAKEWGISDDFFENYELHVHVPKGAIPKDGPSAGVTIATALLSLITQRPVYNEVAMTGEISLTGKVYPIGGVREKTLAALQHNIKTLIIPEGNKDDLKEIPKEIRDKLQFIFVKTIKDVFEIALVKAVETETREKRRFLAEKAA